MNTYIVEPCNYFIENFGPDVFEPATVVRKYLDANESNQEYYQAWSRYNICKVAVKETAKNILEAAHFLS